MKVSFIERNDIYFLLYIFFYNFKNLIEKKNACSDSTYSELKIESHIEYNRIRFFSNPYKILKVFEFD